METAAWNEQQPITEESKHFLAVVRISQGSRFPEAEEFLCASVDIIHIEYHTKEGILGIYT